MDSRNILVTGPAINEQAVKLIADNGYGVTMPSLYERGGPGPDRPAEVDPVGVVVDGTLRSFRH